MRKTGFFMALLLAVAAVACRGPRTGSVSDPGVPELVGEGISRCEAAEGIVLFGIEDRAGEQAVDLFRGYDESLLDSIAAGRQAFRSAFNVYAAVGNGRTVLFDNGLGVKAGGTLLEKLAQIGIEPDEVDDICLTHLHFDHIGGLLTADGQAVFPQATLRLSEAECKGNADNEPWQKVMEAYGGRVATFDSCGMLCDGLVQSIQAFGHTVGHTVYRVGRCLVVGDLLHAQDLQLRHPAFCARYDADPVQAQATRLRFFTLAADSNLYLCGAHCYERFIAPDTLYFCPIQ